MITLRNDIRKQFLKKRLALSPSQQKSASLTIARYCSQLELFQKSQHIAYYYAFRGEIDPNPLINMAEQANKQAYLPILTAEKTLAFGSYKLGDTLAPNRYHIMEPISGTCQLIAINQLDIILVPLVAFDNKNNRLGMGAGYYDKTFAFLKKQLRPSCPQLIGLAYEWQRVESLFAEDWDVPLDRIITEEG
jgi:5-formyltetrahydrofolate cyclo-ligase